MDDYKAARAKCTKKSAACGRDYILVKKLTLWLESKASPGVDDATQTSRLLEFAYRKLSPDKPGHPITLESLSIGHNRCLLVFCILLELGHGDLIHLFQRRNGIDRRLPIPLLSLREIAKNIGVINPDELADGFNNLQWRFCPAIVEKDMGRDFNENEILPFCHKEKINDKGGTAQLWQIEVPEEFVGPELAEAISEGGKYNNPNDDIGPRYNFALKTFEEGKKKLFQNEKEAFQALRRHAGMVRYLGDYGHTEVHRSSAASQNTALDRTLETKPLKTLTSNIILEYGDYDLDEYFIKHMPPVLQSEINSFWERLFDVAYAVKGIHYLKVDPGAGRMQEYNGWHADIKLDNILCVQKQFKLADLGFATFMKKTETEPKKVVAGGTTAYSAPERRYSRNSRRPGAVSQTIDTWSLGCVFSIAATWVVLGYDGIRKFEKLRRRSINKLIEEQPMSSIRVHPLSPGDRFHDGEKVLTDVQNWHIYLRSALRVSDTATSSVLDLVDNYMLIGSASRRIKSNELCEKLGQITKRLKAEAPAFSKAIIAVTETLFDVDEDPPWSTIASTSEEPVQRQKTPVTIADKRQAQKSAFLGAPLKMTAQPSEYLRSYVNSQRAEEDSDIPIIVPSSQTLVAQSRTMRSSLPAPPSIRTSALQAAEASSRRYTIGESPPVVKLQSTSRKPRPDPQDVFEAREKIKYKFGKPVKDELMSKHFKNRDIKFLVDNAGSMTSHWSFAKFLLNTLLLKVAGQDEDGIDLSFTAGNVQVQGKKGESKFKKAMEHQDAQPSPHMATNMKTPLGEIFDDYILDAKRRLNLSQRGRNLTLIVLTDGKWDGTEDKSTVDTKIIEFADQLKKIAGSLKDRPVSIEFIQFGNDPDATSRLRRLDNQLVYHGIPDIVDTEHSTGDVNKMLLGSFVEQYDLYDDDEQLILLSPTTTEFDGLGITETPSTMPGFHQMPGFQQPAGYFSTLSRSEAGLVPTLARSATGGQTQRNTSTADLQREPSTRSSRYNGYH